MSDEWLLPVLIFAAAFLYSSVGHGGGSGYLAAMALVGLSPKEMKPASLLLNVVVAGIGTLRFARGGLIHWRLVAIFATGSVPLAYLGGKLKLQDDVYKPVLGAILLLAAGRLLVERAGFEAIEKRRAPVWLALICGAAIGLISGLTGTGGGIFLSPLLLFMAWAYTRETSGIAVAFILVNSVAGFLGLLTTNPTLPSQLPLWAVVAAVGGLIGSEFGSKRLGNRTLRKLLAVVLAIAGLKMILT